MRGFPRSRGITGNARTPRADTNREQLGNSTSTAALEQDSKDSVLDDQASSTIVDVPISSPVSTRASALMALTSRPSPLSNGDGYPAATAVPPSSTCDQPDPAVLDSSMGSSSRASDADTTLVAEHRTSVPSSFTEMNTARSNNGPLTVITGPEISANAAGVADGRASQTQPAVLSSVTSPPLDAKALQDMFIAMRSTLNVLSDTMDTLGKSAKSLVATKSALEASTHVNVIRQQIAQQQENQESRMQSLRDSLNERLQERIQSELIAKANTLTRDAVRRRIADRVRDQLLVQIPNSLRTELAKCKHQIACVQVDLYNSEARRYNSLLTQSNIHEPLRPLLRPPPPVLSTIDEYGELEPPELDVEPSPSPHFPDTIEALRMLGQKELRALMEDYGLARPAALDGQTAASGVGLRVKGLPDYQQSVADDFVMFRAFVGVNPGEPTP